MRLINYIEMRNYRNMENLVNLCFFFEHNTAGMENYREYRNIEMCEIYED